MSCSELGLTEDALRVSKSADIEILGEVPASIDLTGYTGSFVVRETENATALLTVTETPTANQSVIVFDGTGLLLRLKKDDIASLPLNADDADDPWTGVCEYTVTAPSGLTSRVWLLPLIAERGVVR